MASRKSNAADAKLKQHGDFTVVNGQKPPVSPKPPPPKVKLNFSQLQDKIENLEVQVRQLTSDSMRKDATLKKMEERISQLEHNEMMNASYSMIQKNVSDLLSKRVAQLEQYTRRYSVAISGIEREANETHAFLQEEVTKLLGEAGTTLSLNDVDKLHRNGPRRG